MIEEEYISFKTAKLAKEKNAFIEGCCSVYSPEGYPARTPNGGKWDWERYKVEEFCLRTTQTILSKWIREVYRLSIEPYYCKETKLFNVTIIFMDEAIRDIIIENFDTYEEAMEAGLQKALKSI